ncbi:sialidase family protein [Ascidiimonas sp. W6]|uniref:sialidase family protein n=1 Tax=Ascidiimonas meishanensis TaxID=3128903 RepID=UPI0030EF085A
MRPLALQILILIMLFLAGCETTKSPIENKQKAFQSKKAKNIKIFEASVGLGPCEPSIYINPLDTNNMVVGSVINYAHTSFDGGLTWETKALKSSLGVWGDPCVIADKDGIFYYLHLSDPEGTSWQSDKILDRIVIQRSEDGGKSWSDGNSIGLNPPKQQDKEWAATNPKTGEIYVTWTEFDKYDSENPKDKSRILFSKSNDKGTTWSKPIAINEFDGNTLDNDLTVEGAVPAVANNGNIYVAWAFNDKIYFDKSIDNGNTWLEKDIVVTEQIGGWTQKIPGIGRSNGMPVTCVDNSKGTHSGTIYVNFTDQRNGPNNTDVFITKSIDSGNSWSTPVKVNSDSTNTHQFLTWMSVDPATGFLYVIYYDRSAYNNTKTDVSMAVSYDGGHTFESKVISESPFTPNDAVFFGDYNNINAFQGVVRPVWTSVDNYTLSIWTAIIDLEKN